MGLTQSTLNIIGTLCISASTSAFASNGIALMVAKQWFYKGKPSIVNRFIGLLVNIKNKKDAHALFEGGKYEEIEKRNDTQSQARGVFWLFAGTILLIIALSI